MITEDRVATGPQECPRQSSWNPLPFITLEAVGEKLMIMNAFRMLWSEEQGQDIAEYAVMLAVILVIVVGTIRLIGSNANNVFSNVASSIQ
jgi:Flp pilus assembly pilin Flp